MQKEEQKSNLAYDKSKSDEIKQQSIIMPDVSNPSYLVNSRNNSPDLTGRSETKN